MWQVMRSFILRIRSRRAGRWVLRAYTSKGIRWTLLLILGLAACSWVAFEWRAAYRRGKALELSQAVIDGELETTRALLEGGVDPDWKTVYSKSVREYAEQ